MRWLLFVGCVFWIVSCASSPSSVHRPMYTPAPVVFGPPGDPRNPTHGPFQPNAELYVCAGRVTNPPPFDASSRATNFSPIVVVGGKIVMASVPANDVCLSSGFGLRGGRLHSGSDYAPYPRGGPRTVYTAAPGRVVEAGYSNGLGNHVVIDHGSGVYTRYAHLASIASWVFVGAEIGFGHGLGQMGKSGNATGVHLHFEVLTGDLADAGSSFNLKTNDPLSFPAWSGLDSVS